MQVWVRIAPHPPAVESLCRLEGTAQNVLPVAGVLPACGIPVSLCVCPAGRVPGAGMRWAGARKSEVLQKCDLVLRGL